jgi:Helix-turn-helix domain
VTVVERARPRPNPGWVPTKDAAEYVGCSEGHLRNLRYRGEGPRYVKKGGLVRYRIADLDAWLFGKTPR